MARQIRCEGDGAGCRNPAFEAPLGAIPESPYVLESVADFVRVNDQHPNLEGIHAVNGLLTLSSHDRIRA